MPGIFTLMVVGCGRSGNDGSGGGGSSRGQGSTCDPVAYATINAAGSNARVCTAFIECLGSKCEAAAKECAGPDVALGSYAGT